RTVRSRGKFVPDLFEKGPQSALFDGLERDPVDTRGAVIGLGHRIGLVEGLHLADVDVQPPEAPRRFRLRLDVDPPPQVLQIAGRLYHLAPASPRVGGIRTAGPLRSAGITPPRRYCGPIRHPLASSRLPAVSGYTAGLAPPLSRAGRGGLPQLLSACPCHRAVATTPPEQIASSANLPRSVRPSPDDRGLGLRG